MLRAAGDARQRASVGFEVQAAFFLERTPDGVPVQTGVLRDVTQRHDHALFHAFQATHIKTSVAVFEQGRHIGCAVTQGVLHIALGLALFAREGEFDVDEIFGQVVERTKVCLLYTSDAADE